ncbi:unnamed protein product, partial [Polarella glacialis]
GSPQCHHRVAAARYDPKWRGLAKPVRAGVLHQLWKCQIQLARVVERRRGVGLLRQMASQGLVLNLERSLDKRTAEIRRSNTINIPEGDLAASSDVAELEAEQEILQGCRR